MKPTRATALFLLSALAALSCGKEEDGPATGGPPPPPPPPTTGPTSASGFAVDFISAHNQARAGTLTGIVLIPTPSPTLGALTWSQAAADIAQAWADGCNYAHNSNRGADGTQRGENIAAFGSTGTPVSSPTETARLWADEWPDYDYSTNTCAAGKMCGHYTQVVWRTTTKVGCAMASCTVNSPWGAAFPNWHFYVCDYEPPGNWVGQRPY